MSETNLFKGVNILRLKTVIEESGIIRMETNRNVSSVHKFSCNEQSLDLYEENSKNQPQFLYK